jgi:PAS domain S-box-containing protein
MSASQFVDHFKDATFLQSVIDSIDEGVIVEKEGGIIIGFNERALQILEMSAEELSGKSSYDDDWNAVFIDETVAPAHELPISITLETNEPQKNKIIGIKIKQKPRKWININTRIIPTTSGNYGLATFSDITELVESIKLLNQQKERVRLSEEKFTNIFRYSHIAIAITGTDGVILDVNKATCNLLQYSRDELIGKHFAEITFPEDVINAQRDVLDLVHKKVDFYQGERRYIKKDKSFCWGLNTVSAVFKENGEVDFFVSQVQEITDLKELNKSLEERNIKLTNVQQTLEKKVSQLKDFAGIITHDVRGPAHNIKKMLEMYESADDPEIKKASMDYLRKVSNDLTNNLNELIQILQIHLENELPSSDCSFKEIIESVSLQLQDLILKKGAVITYDLLCSNIQYPKVYLQSILYNLISNSLKYNVPNIPPSIHIKTYKEFGAVFLKVTDQGIGIDMQRYGHLLFKFQKSFHSGYDSKGIGLYLIKNQIEDQGGSISAASEPGKGTIFTVRF